MSRNLLFITLFVTLLLGLTLASSGTGVASDGGLPSRVPTATPIPPTATPIPPMVTSIPATGGLIFLGIQATSPVSSSLWTIVQWQDALGNWHGVDGWQGNFNERLEVVWWVAPEDLGKGPFRWVVYEQRYGNKEIGHSQSFDLPAYNQGSVKVEVVIP